MTPYERSRKVLEGLDVRRLLEASDVPVEIATAIADALEPEGMERDAERYRFLRQIDHSPQVDIICTVKDAAELDAAIDKQLDMNNDDVNR